MRHLRQASTEYLQCVWKISQVYTAVVLQALERMQVDLQPLKFVPESEGHLRDACVITTSDWAKGLA